jgi:hypothetical protein
MRKFYAALLVLSLLTLTGFTCQERPDPPSAVEVRVAIPVPCTVPEPQCSAPAYDAARKEQPADQKAKLLRAEAIGQEDCLRRYREALSACR